MTFIIKCKAGLELTILQILQVGFINIFLQNFQNVFPEAIQCII